MRSIAEYYAKTRSRKARRSAKHKIVFAGRPTQTPRKVLESKCDTLWSLCIKLRDRKNHGPMCRICGYREGTVAYHIIPRQHGKAVRWDIENGVLACSPCNFGEMVNRALFRDKHIRLFGEGVIKGLEFRARDGRGKQIPLEGLEQIKKSLLEALEHLGATR